MGFGPPGASYYWGMEEPHPQLIESLGTIAQV